MAQALGQLVDSAARTQCTRPGEARAPSLSVNHTVAVACNAARDWRKAGALMSAIVSLSRMKVRAHPRAMGSEVGLPLMLEAATAVGEVRTA
ncbi:MAG: hypothetical protein IPM80_20555 [Proteobacteria bacterium]|nr:hypothetical protein [Pseudomonadota bacterium]